MSPIALALSPDDIADVAAYYASAETPFSILAAPDPDLVKKGQELSEAGIGANGVPACSACHGERGAGELPTVPYLAGQYEHYTASELMMWQQGLRRNSSEAMALFARKLDDHEIAALAAYFQEVRSSTSAPTQGKQ